MNEQAETMEQSMDIAVKENDASTVSPYSGGPYQHVDHAAGGMWNLWQCRRELQA